MKCFRELQKAGITDLAMRPRFCVSRRHWLQSYVGCRHDALPRISLASYDFFWASSCTGAHAVLAQSYQLLKSQGKTENSCRRGSEAGWQLRMKWQAVGMVQSNCRLFAAAFSPSKTRLGSLMLRFHQEQPACCEAKLQPSFWNELCQA